MYEYLDAMKSPYGVIVTFRDIPANSCREASCGYDALQMDVQRSANGLEDKVYAFPPEWVNNQTLSGNPKPNMSNCTTTWGTSCFNCATYPESIGVPIPETTGVLEVYIKDMIEENGTYCRCFRNGEWRPEQECSNTGQTTLMSIKGRCQFDDPSPLVSYAWQAANAVQVLLALFWWLILHQEIARTA